MKRLHTREDGLAWIRVAFFVSISGLRNWGKVTAKMQRIRQYETEPRLRQICYSVQRLKVDTIMDTAEFYGWCAYLFCLSPSYE